MTAAQTVALKQSRSLLNTLQSEAASLTPNSYPTLQIMMKHVALASGQRPWAARAVPKTCQVSYPAANEADSRQIRVNMCLIFTLLWMEIASSGLCLRG